MKNIEKLLGELQAGDLISAKTKKIILEEILEKDVDIEKSSTVLIYNIYAKGRPEKISHKMPLNQIGMDIARDIFLKNLNLSKREASQIAMFIQITFAKG